MRLRFLVPAALCFTSLLAMTSAKHAPPTRRALYAAMNGSWTGTLEYKDYSRPDRRVTLPTKLAISFASDSSAMLMHYVYDDGPGKIVEDDDRFASNAEVTRIAWGGVTSKSAQQYDVSSPVNARPQGQVSIVLQGEGQDDNKPATIRETITITADTLRILKETRVTGGEFAFRHVYLMHR